MLIVIILFFIELIVILLLVRKGVEYQSKLALAFSRAKQLQAKLDELRVQSSLHQSELKYTSKQLKKAKRILYRLRITNAHDIRGPLARILGIAFLTRKDSKQLLKEKCEYFEMIEINAKEIDNVLKKVNADIEKGFNMGKTLKVYPRAS